MRFKNGLCIIIIIIIIIIRSYSTLPEHLIDIVVKSQCICTKLFQNFRENDNVLKEWKPMEGKEKI